MKANTNANTVTPASSACPLCGSIGKAVSAVTISAQVQEHALAALATTEGFRFCAEKDCPAVYYRGTEDGEDEIFSTAQTHQIVFQKSNDPERFVCYCFQHRVGEVAAQVAKAGPSSPPAIIAGIRANCASGFAACEQNNPQGSCCLGNVFHVIKAAQPATAPDAGKEACCDHTCCDPPSPAPAAASRVAASRTLWISFGAVLSALLASACCWLPLLLLALGASAAGVSGFIDTWRLPLLGVAAVLLGLAFCANYRRRPCRVTDAACTSRSRRRLWITAVGVVAFASLPHYIGTLLPAGENATAIPEGESITWKVHGMTCEACAPGLAAILGRVPGVTAASVDYASATVRLSVEPAEKSSALDAARQAIHDSGYTLADGPDLSTSTPASP